MLVYLAQHGLALPKETDPERPLSDQGREDIARCAGFLSLFVRPRPAEIVHSGKLRAAQSAAMFAEAWQICSISKGDGLAPHDDPSIWHERLHGEHRDLMLVGHLPHLERLTGLLLCGHEGARPVRMRNGGVSCLERDGNCWHLLWSIHPAMFYRQGD